jgi:hypothetical protein
MRTFFCYFVGSVTSQTDHAGFTTVQRVRIAYAQMPNCAHAKTYVVRSAFLSCMRIGFMMAAFAAFADFFSECTLFSCHFPLCSYRFAGVDEKFMHNRITSTTMSRGRRVFESWSHITCCVENCDYRKHITSIRFCPFCIPSFTNACISNVCTGCPVINFDNQPPGDRSLLAGIYGPCIVCVAQLLPPFICFSLILLHHFPQFLFDASICVFRHIFAG